MQFASKCAVFLILLVKIHLNFCLLFPLTRLCLASHKRETNNADPDKTPQNAASDQGLDCLLTGISLKNKQK